MLEVRTGPIWYSNLTNSDDPSNFFDAPSSAGENPVIPVVFKAVLGHGLHASAIGPVKRKMDKERKRRTVAMRSGKRKKEVLERRVGEKKGFGFLKAVE